MTIRIYNTLSGRKEVFEPIEQYIKRFVPPTLDRLKVTKPNSVHIIVTHDLVIDIAQRKFLGVNTGADDFDIAFLGGLGLAIIDGVIRGYQNGQEVPLIMKDS